FPYERNIFRTNRNNYFNDSDSWETQGRLYIGNEHTSSNVNTLNISCDKHNRRCSTINSNRPSQSTSFGLLRSGDDTSSFGMNAKGTTICKLRGYSGYCFSPRRSDKEESVCMKCKCTIDRRVVEKKKKIYENFFLNSKRYYKEKRRKINYLAYDLSILKEYLYTYLKKYFDDIIVLFEYFFALSNNYFSLDTEGDGSTIATTAATEATTAYTTSNRSTVIDTNVEQTENGSMENEDLLYELFALSSYDNFNNEDNNIIDWLSTKSAEHRKYYNDYMYIKKLKFFIKNDIIQFIIKNVNFVSSNIHLKIGRV
ncbi:hypothetical protein PMLGA01_120031100, partial [Plasmodium malariae]